MLSIKNLKKTYNLGDPILRGINLTIDKGEMVYLVGPSGAGKSTLIRMIYREEIPDDGFITLGTIRYENLKQRNIPSLRRQLGVIFQDFKLIAERTARENIALALEVAGKSRREISTRVSELLRLVGLLHRKNNYPDQLSGGECQRVAIARALANEPLLLLADEPTGNLDRENSESLIKLLEEINIRGCSILMATHSIDLIQSKPQRKIYITDGLLKEEGR